MTAARREAEVRGRAAKNDRSSGSGRPSLRAPTSKERGRAWGAP